MKNKPAALGMIQTPAKLSHIGSAAGFTLVEILAAVALLAILLTVLVQLTNAVNQSIRYSNQIVDAAAQSRVAFDRIGGDLEGLIKRSDTDFVAQNAATGSLSNVLLFLSNVSSASNSNTNVRDVSLIAYEVSSNANNGNRPCLVRAGKPTTWTGANSGVFAGFIGLGPNGLPVSLNPPPANLNPAVADFDVLSAGTIRMVVGFQLYPDNNPVTLDDGSSIPNAQGQIVYHAPVRALTPTGGGTAINYADLSRISAIVVSLVTIDANHLNLLNSGQITALANTFPAPTNNDLCLKTWAPLAENSGGLPASVPLSARQAIRVFQHFFPVNPFGLAIP